MKLYSFQRDTADAERIQHIANGDVDGFTAAEIAVRLFAVESHISAIVCEVRQCPDLMPRLLVSVIPGSWRSAGRLDPTMIAALDQIRLLQLAAVELLPTTFV